MITQKTPNDHIQRHLMNEVAKRERVLARNLKYVGEQCVNYARDHGTYEDQTGNLRSSVGYIVVQNGKVIAGSRIGTNEGGEKAREFLDKLINEFSNQTALIVVAGMNYASSVEAKGYDVITGSELLAERLVPEMLTKLGYRVQ